MAYARVSYEGDGTTKIYSVPFSYISQDYVEVRVAGVLKAVTTDYTWLTDSTIQFVTAPKSGKLILLNRNTPKEERLVNFQDGNILKEETLDLDSDQAFHIAQEALDAVENVREVETFVAGVDFTSGSTTSLTLSGGDVLGTSIEILFDGVAQQVTEYTAASGVITFNSAIPTGVAQVQVSYAVPLTGGIPDGAVTTGKIADLNVTTGKIADLGVTTGKLAHNVLSADSAGRGKMADGFITQAKLGTNVAGTGPLFSAANSASQSLSSGVETKMLLGTEVVDTASGFASGKFIAPIPGFYQFNWIVNCTGNPINDCYSRLRKNGSVASAAPQMTISTGANALCLTLVGSEVILLAAGDAIELHCSVVGITPAAASARLFGYLVRAA